MKTKTMTKTNTGHCRILVLAVGAMLMAASALYADDKRGNVKVLNYGNINGSELNVFPASQIDSITFRRATLDLLSMDKATPEQLLQIAPLMYPVQSPAMICELSGDNLVDNNMVVPKTNLKAYYNSGLEEKLYHWEDIHDECDEEDSPVSVWRSYLLSISVCDYILEAVAQLESSQSSQSVDLKAYKAEALLLRSYLRFVLSSVFDTDFAGQVEADLLAGLALADHLPTGDATRMNPQAANAYAARYYLLKHDWAKVEQYANAALGSNPASLLRKWSQAEGLALKNQVDWYYNPKTPANFLVEKTNSMRDRIFSACRFAINVGQEGIASPQRVLFTGGGPTWTGYMPCFYSGLYIWGNQDYGVWLFRSYENFEYVDETLQTGYVYNKYTPFTAEETLLMRAEARFYSGNANGCIDDLSLWTHSRLVSPDLTQRAINVFYTPQSHADWLNDVHMEETGWSTADIATASQNKPLLDCLLHFRRIETVYDGLRWMDIQRYGITVKHVSRYPYGEPVTDSLTLVASTGKMDQRYRRNAPAGTDATDRKVASIHLKDKPAQSFYVTPGMEIMFGGDDAADETARSSFKPEPYGWALHTFDMAGEGTTTLIDNADMEMAGDGLLTLTRSIDGEKLKETFHVGRYQPGEEILLDSRKDNNYYPEVLHLQALPKPWADYQKDCMQSPLSLWFFNSYCSDSYRMQNPSTTAYYAAPYVVLGKADDAETGRHTPIVYTPTGIRFADESVLGCNPEFVLDTLNNALTSADGLVTFKPDWDAYILAKLRGNKNFEMQLETTNMTLKEYMNSLSEGLTAFNSNYTFRSLLLGKTPGMNPVHGIGMVFYSNAEKTKTLSCGVAAEFSFSDGHAVITVPGLKDGTFGMDRNCEVLMSKSELIKSAYTDVLKLLQGEYTYTFDIQMQNEQTTTGVKRSVYSFLLHLVKANDPTITFTVNLK